MSKLDRQAKVELLQWLYDQLDQGLDIEQDWQTRVAFLDALRDLGCTEKEIEFIAFTTPKSKQKPRL